jgi:hypothetical protein
MAAEQQNSNVNRSLYALQAYRWPALCPNNQANTEGGRKWERHKESALLS